MQSKKLQLHKVRRARGTVPFLKIYHSSVQPTCAFKKQVTNILTMHVDAGESHCTLEGANMIRANYQSGDYEAHLL